MTESATGNPLFQGLPMDMASWIKYLEELREKVMGLSGASSLGLDSGMFGETLEKLIAYFRNLASAGGQVPTDPTAWMQWVQDSFKSVADTHKFSSLMDPNSFFDQIQQMMKRGNESLGLASAQGLPQLNELFDPGFWLRTGERNLRQTADLLATWQNPSASKRED